MGTSDRAYDQVKSILGKLDRNIDQARSRRLQDVAPMQQRPMTNGAAMHTHPTPFFQASVGAGPQQPQMAPPMPAPAPLPPRPSKSGFGRAQPLRRPAVPPATS